MRHSKRVTRISFSYEKGSRGSFDNYFLIKPADELMLQKVCAYLLVETEAITSAEWMDKSCVMSLRRLPQIRHFLGNVKSSSRSNNFLVADGNTTSRMRPLHPYPTAAGLACEATQWRTQHECCLCNRSRLLSHLILVHNDTLNFVPQ